MLLIRFLIIILLSTQYANAFDTSRYEDGNIDDICKNYENTIKDELEKNGSKSLPMEIFTNGKAYKIKLKYLDEIRPVSKEHYNDLISFGKALPWISPKVNEIATKEILVSSKDGLKHWIPIQDALIPSLQAEIKKNKEFYVYVIAILHHVDLSYKCDGTYLINEFQIVTKESLEKEKIKKLYDKGQSLLKENKLDQAESIFKEILKITPNHDDALSNLCLIAQDRNQFNKALECYDKVIEIDPNAYEAFFSKGVIFLKQEKAKEAVKEFDRAIILMTEQKLPPYALANAYYLRANSKILLNSKDAIIDMEKAREINPNRISKEQLEELRKKFKK